MTTMIYSMLLPAVMFIVLLVFAVRKIWSEPVVQQGQDQLSALADNKSAGDEHFTKLISAVTPLWYWRVNHEYSDFINATIRRMSMVQLTDTAGLFEAQRRCSDLNAAVYNYYTSLKKRCLDGELVPFSDLDVLNMRHCFDEFSLKAYPNLVALVWPEFQRPELLPDAV